MWNPQTNNTGSNDITIDFFWNRKVFSIDWLFSDLRRFCFCLGSTIGCALGLRPNCERTELERYALYTLIYNFLFIIWPGPTFESQNFETSITFAEVVLINQNSSNVLNLHFVYICKLLKKLSIKIWLF